MIFESYAGIILKNVVTWFQSNYLLVLHKTLSAIHSIMIVLNLFSDDRLYNIKFIPTKNIYSAIQDFKNCLESLVHKTAIVSGQY